MHTQPYMRLDTPRSLNTVDLPPDLALFYSRYKGVGLESSSDRIVRLCRLDEVTRIGWRDIHIFGQYDCPRWAVFAGFRIGVSSFFDEIFYVLDCPCCPPGSILTIGVDVAGPGGTGLLSEEWSLVLAPDFFTWLKQLDRCDWIEYGFVPGYLADLPHSKQRELRRFYKLLNPLIQWGGSDADDPA